MSAAPTNQSILSIEFARQLIVLFLTVLISGFLIPYILKRIDNRRTSEQKEKEAQLSRQTTLINTQSEFLDTISKLLWQWRYISIRLTYYSIQNDVEKYKNAKSEYDENFWEVLSELRYQVSRSRRLVSEEAYKNLKSFYLEIVEIDKNILNITSLEDPIMKRIQWGEMNNLIFFEITEEIDFLINQLAIEVKLSANSNTIL